MPTILFFLSGLAVLPFSNGRWLCATAGFAGPLLLTLFIRSLPLKKGLILGFLLLLFTSLISWYSVNKVVSGPLLIGGVILASLLMMVPYAVDRWLRPVAHHSWLKTLFMPVSGVAMDTLFSLLIADQGSIAYSQFENLPLLQLASVTGLTGITFVIGWTAAFGSWLYENKFSFKKCRAGIYFFVATIAVVLEFGLYRLSTHPMPSDLIPVAAITSNRENRITHEDLLIKTLEAHETGAKVILWSEVLGSQTEGLQDFAREMDIFLLAAVGIKSANSDLLDNKVLLIDPAGALRFSYRKANLSPGEPSLQGEKVFAFADTLAGRFGAAICADMSFSHFIRAAGKNGVDIVFDPAAEWPEVARIQTSVPIFRAVENGFNLVKATSHGSSIVADYTGRILAQTDRPSEETLIASVPNRGTMTLYSQGGWLFGFMNLFLFFVILILATRKNFNLQFRRRY